MMPGIGPSVEPGVSIPTRRKAICEMSWSLKNEIGDWGVCPYNSICLDDFSVSCVGVNRYFQAVWYGGHDRGDFVEK